MNASQTPQTSAAPQKASAPSTAPKILEQSLFRACLFKVGEHRLAVKGKYLKQVSPIHAVTAVPRSPDSLQGLVAIEGSIVPLINSFVLFPDDSSQPLKTDLAVLLEHRGISMAFLLSEVLGFHEFETLYEPSPDQLSNELELFALGSVSYEDAFFSVLDAEKLLRLVEAQILVV